MSLHDTQTSIEYMYDRRRVSGMISRDIADTPELYSKIEKCLGMLAYTYLMGPHFNQKNQYLAGLQTSTLEKIIYRVLEVIMPQPKGMGFSSLVGLSAGAMTTADKLIAFKIVSSVIGYMYHAGLVKIIRAGDSETGMMEVLPTYTCDKKISDFIQQSMYLPPMVCAPNKLVANNSCGYLTIKQDALILKGYNYHEGNICLDSLNKFNDVAYSLDVQMLTTFDEEPKQLLDTHEKELQFSKLREDSYEVYKLLIQSGNHFFFTHKVDKRGRTYCQGYHASTQGNSFRKAIINLAHQEIVDGSFS